jgi:hypothetical protein
VFDPRWAAAALLARCGEQVQQIAMIKEELVVKQKWISPAEFNKARAAQAQPRSGVSLTPSRLVARMLSAPAGPRRMRPRSRSIAHATAHAVVALRAARFPSAAALNMLFGRMCACARVIPLRTQVFAVYQALPGPEATELACYFGQISNGRIGGLLGGVAFCLPGAAARPSSVLPGVP